jgi:hypothetical protein
LKPNDILDLDDNSSGDEILKKLNIKLSIKKKSSKNKHTSALNQSLDSK